MFGKDLVSGCSTDQNNLSKFVNRQMTQDRSNWNNMGAANAPMQSKPWQSFHEKNQLAIHDPEILAMVESFEKSNLQHSGNRPSLHQKPLPILDEYLKSFIHSNAAKQNFRPLPLPELGLSGDQKMKMQRRAATLTRHLHPGQSEQFIQTQVHALLQPLGGSSQFEQNMMVKEFESFQNSMSNEFQQFQHFQNMENAYREVEANNMAHEFQRFRHFQNMDSAYKEVEEQARFLEEWEGKRPISKFEPNPNQSIKEIAQGLARMGQQDPKMANSRFFNLMNGIGEEKQKFTDTGVVHVSDIKEEIKDWEEFQRQEEAQNLQDWQNFQQNDSELLLKQFQNMMMMNNNAQNQESLYDDWNKIAQVETFDYDSLYRHYDFHERSENPYMTEANPFQKGLDLFNQGYVPQSILAFEAAILRSEEQGQKGSPEQAQMWYQLGLAHQECDKDAKAISCLLHATEMDPLNDQAHVSLTVSYTNEVGREQALDTLKKWLALNPKYNHIKAKGTPNTNFDDLHHSVTSMFLEAAALTAHDPDPEVQIGLGLLFNLNLDYNKAIDCFRIALTKKPEDYSLWNKLGATLANSSRFEEALDCYFRALTIKPSYVRARANLGISYMGLKQHDLAVKHFLRALSMHSPANHLWGHVQLCFMAIGRSDLVQQSVLNPDPEQFRKDFDF